MAKELSRFQSRLAEWQRDKGTARVVLVATLFSCVVSFALCNVLVLSIYGTEGFTGDTLPLTMILPLVVPAIVAPIVTLQLATALATAARVIDDLSIARQELQSEVATRKRTQLELEHLALRDPLTGLLNRRGFFDAVAALSADQLTNLVLATIDIDRFKDINDQHGHAVGDRVLCAVAAQLQTTAGPTAIVTRLGGDEFAAALIEGGDPEQIRLTLSEVSFTGTDHGELKVRCSVGLAPHREYVGIDTTLARADASLYEEKSRRAAVVSPPTSTASTSA